MNKLVGLGRSLDNLQPEGARGASIAASLGLVRCARESFLLLVSVDPQRDTPTRLREYMRAFDPTFLAL